MPTTLQEWTRLAGSLEPRAEIFVDGKYRAARSEATFDSVNPATGELLARVSSAEAV
ncbi:MAG: 4-(gamma-glutamylamino)butanal dehydrogenase, partial [Mycobacterium sp.]|nr:4-(gamma-glutamylamino)butanal dehydrogenase [Mycobacterium sp.]